jgi:hypothetical protein
MRLKAHSYLTAGESLCARYSLMRIRIDRSIVYSRISDTRTQRTSPDSLLGVVCPPSGLAVRTTENSCRLAVAGVEDHVLGVGVDADDAGDCAVDPGFLEGIADCGLGD